MTFLHKLAQRLARLKTALILRLPTSRHRAVLLCVALFAACEQQPDAFGPDFGVLSISLTPRIDTVLVGDSIQLTATVVTNNNKPPRALNWTSAMSALASVSQTGMVHALHAGSGFIVASSGNKKDSAAVTVSSPLPPPPVPVALVVVSPASTTALVGATTQLTATPEDGNGNPLTGRPVTWASNNAGVATVNTSGLVTSAGLGTATITATSEGQSGTSALTVTPVPVASVGVSPASASITTGQTVQLTATPQDANGNALAGRVVTWSSSNTALATVNGSGLVTGVAAGATTITATSETKTGTAAVTVTVTPVPVASVSVSPASVSVTAGQTVQLTATPKDANGNALAGRVVTWGSSNTALATVNGSGLVTAVAPGSVTITATSEGQSGTSAVTVTPVPVASVSVSPASVSVTTGQTVQLTATPKDANGNTLTGRVVTWGSSNTAVATANGSGLVTGVAAGSATITATSEGKSGTAALTVTLVPVASVGVSPASASVTTGLTVQLTATPKDANGNVLSGRTIAWASNATTVATVSGSGLVSGVSAGSATITATSEGKSGTAAITVTAPLPPPSGSCLTQTGTTTTVSGLQTSGYSNTGLASNTKINASTAQYLAPITENIPVHIAGGSSICWSGGQILGRSPPNTIYNTMHDRYGMVVGVTGSTSAGSAKIENVTIFDYGDGISFDSQGDVDWSIKNVHVKYSRDDCVENDFLNSGTIDSSFFDGCYQGMSAQIYYTPTQDGSNNLVVMKNSLMRLQDVDQPYSGPLPNGNPLWKWDVLGPKLALYNNVYRIDSKAWESSSDGIRETMAPPAGKLVDCQNNVVVWLGAGSFPYTFPLTFNGKTCFTIMTGQAGRDYWNNAVAQWQANHPNLLSDVGPPIVSLFSPGLTGSTTLTGTVSLTATAVDDQDIAGVQFKLNGQSIGSEVTTESTTTKFVLTWDSRGLANGTYALTATARDAAGHTTTSGNVTVTISN